MAKGDEITTRFRVDVSDLKKGITEARKQIELANAKFKAASSGMDDWSKSSEGLNAKIKQLGTLLTQEQIKLKNYQEQLKKQQDAYAENGKRADELRAKLKQLADQGVSKTSEEYKKYQKALTQVEKEQLSNQKSAESLNTTILNQQGTINKLERDLGNYKTTLTQVEKAEKQAAKTGQSVDDVLKEMDESSRKASEGFTVMKGALASLVADGLRKAVSLAKEFATSMIDVAAEVKASNSQFEQTFGDMQETAEKAINRVADSTGILSTRLKDNASQIFAFARANGATVPQAMELMETALMASADSAAYYDKSLEESTETLQSFLKGNYANDAALGVSATEFTRNAKATELFGEKYNDLTEIQKQQTLLKMVTDSQKVSGAMGQAAREADGWQNVQGNLNETWRQFKAQVGTPFLEALIPVVQNVTKSFQNWQKSVDWDAFGKKVQEAIGKMIDGFQWIIKHKSTIITAIKAIIAAFVIKKIANFTSAISAMGKQFVTTATTGKNLVTITKNMTAAQKANTIATNAGAVATNLFSAAWKANPIGVAVTGVTLLASGIKGLVSWLSSGTKKTDENVEATKRLIEKQNELNESIKENATSRKEAIESAGEEAATAEILSGKLDDLMKVENKSREQKEKIKQIVSQLNTLIPELNLKYDEERDALNKTTEAIKLQVTATKELAKAKAAEAQLSQIAADMAKLELEKADLIKQNTKNQNAYNEAKEKLNKFVELYGMNEITQNRQLQNEYIKLSSAMNSKKTALDDSKKALDQNAESIAKLNGEYDKTSDYASKLFDQAEIKQKLSELTEIAKEAGVKIPEALVEGMETGKYVVPASIEELNKLIKFDEALKKAKLDGVEIPKSISSGVISGKVSVEDAIKQVNDVVNFNTALEKATNDGIILPKNLADNMLKGEISVKAANETINNAIEFTKALKQASSDGVAIPENLAENVKNGKVTVDEANKLINDAIKFDSALDKAKQDGIVIPNNLATQIKDGKITVDEANTIINDAIKFNKALTEATEKGYEIPTILSQQIISGKLSVEEANTQMNTWIKFTDALNKSEMAGAKIPTVLTDNILNGETSVNDAVKQMNNWVKFQAALTAADLAGTNIPVKMQEGILNGKLKPQEAIAQLNANAKSEASKLPGQTKSEASKVGNAFSSGINNKNSRYDVKQASKKLVSEAKSGVTDKKGFEQAGKDNIDGVKQGIKNRDKQNGVFSSLWSFGKSMLAKLRASLDENSPSKEGDEIGQFLLKGVSNGIKKQTKPVLNQVTAFGKDVMSNLQSELSNNINMGVVRSNLQTSLSNARSGLSNMSLSTPTTATNGNAAPGVNNNSTVNNFTQNIYAPKEPSRIELYRQTRNLLNYVKREG